MKRCVVGLVLAFALAVSAVSAAGALTAPAGAGGQGYTVTDLGAPTSPYSFADVNSRGQIVGGYPDGYLWDKGVRTPLGDLGGGITEPRRINERGQVVGYSWTGTWSVAAFLWQDGEMTNLGALPGDASSMATDINARGQVVGESADGVGRLRAVLWEHGRITDLGTLGGQNSSAAGINDRGQVVGWSDTTNDYPAPRHAFLWDKGVMTDLGLLGGGSASIAVDINDRGQIVGWGDTTNGGSYEQHPFLWDQGSMTDLGTLGGTYPYAYPYAIDNAGAVVGRGSTEHGDEHAFLWENGVMTELGPHSSAGQGLNNQGEIVGYVLGEGGLHVAVWERMH